MYKTRGIFLWDHQIQKPSKRLSIRSEKIKRSGPFKKYTECAHMCVFSKCNLEKRNAKLPCQFQIQHSTKQRNFYYYPHTRKD